MASAKRDPLLVVRSADRCKMTKEREAPAHPCQIDSLGECPAPHVSIIASAEG